MNIFKSQLSACPVCLSPHIRFWMVKEKGGIEFNIYKCFTCKTGFLNPQPLKSYLQSIYILSGHGLTKEVSLQEVLASEKQYPNATIDARRLVGYAKQFLNKSNLVGNLKLKALDIGSGYGFFTGAALKEGFSVKAINPGTWENKVFEEMHGFSPMHEYFEDVDFGEEKFDLVILSQVLEHIENPQEFIAKIRSTLNKSGVLAIAVPNVGSFLVRILKYRETGCLWVPEHLFYFSKQGLITLFEEKGFEILKQTYVSRLPYNIISKRLRLSAPFQNVADLSVKFSQVIPLKIIDFLGLGIMHNIWAQAK